MNKLSGLFVVIAFCWLAVFVSGCARFPSSALPVPSPTATSSPSDPPSPGSSPTPGACGTPASNASAFVVISVIVLPTTVPVYGGINGYVLANPDGTFGLTAQVLTVHSNDVVQFVNIDGYGGTTPIYHSAVGFPAATNFPAVPYSFPSTAQQPLGTSISPAQRSTGRFSAFESAVCYSAPFTLSTGTYYLGDYDFYNSLNSLRDVISVQASSALARRSKPVLPPR